MAVISGRGAFLLAAACVLAAAAVFGVLRWATGDAPGGGPGGRGGFGGPVTVSVASAGTMRFAETIEAVGTARALESVTITAKVTETIGAVNFEDGQRVEAGEVLVELVDAEEAAGLTAARAELAEAEKQLVRIRDLARTGNAPRSRLDTAVAARDGARARVEQIEARLADRLIRAPFAGVLGLRLVSPGTLARPGDAITTLDDISVIRLDFTVAETFFAALREGLVVTARSAAYPDRDFPGLVSAVDSRIDPRTRSVVVRADIPNADGLLRPGMLMTLALETNQRDGIGVPEASVVAIQDRHYVYRVDAENHAERVDVKIGARKPGFIEIREGLAAGARIVSAGTNKVRPGAQLLFEGATPPGEQPVAAEPGRERT